MPTSIYQSPQWRKLRRRVFRRYGLRCMKCRAKHGLEVDHIIPASIRPELALKMSNLQILCGTKANSCNQKKSDNDCRDYRPIKWKSYYFIIRTGCALLKAALLLLASLGIWYGYDPVSFAAFLAQLPSPSFLFDILNHHFSGSIL